MKNFSSILLLDLGKIEYLLKTGDCKITKEINLEKIELSFSYIHENKVFLFNFLLNREANKNYLNCSASIFYIQSYIRLIFKLKLTLIYRFRQLV
jgi:hypothetical protein